MSQNHIKLSSRFGHLQQLNLDIVDSTTYSSETPHHFTQLNNIITEIHADSKNKTLQILDGTAHIGGFSLQLALANAYCQITAIEIDKHVFNCLTSNISKLHLNHQITAINMDFTKWIDEQRRKQDNGSSSSSNEEEKSLKTHIDIIYLDPPWGGPNYKDYENMELYLSNTNITSVIDQLKQLEICKKATILLKVPVNYNFQNFVYAPRVHIFSNNPHKSGYPDYYVLIL